MKEERMYLYSKGSTTDSERSSAWLVGMFGNQLTTAITMWTIGYVIGKACSTSISADATIDNLQVKYRQTCELMYETMTRSKYV
jgi:hypothetical protein